MFGDNLRKLRKAKGYTQEELAIKLNVVRQTVSKWEKGLSVPDVETLSKMAEILDTDISTLLGKEVNINDADEDPIAMHLGKISEQMAIKNRRSKKIWKGILISVIIFILINVLFIVSGIIAYDRYAFTQTDIVTEETVEIESDMVDLS